MLPVKTLEMRKSFSTLSLTKAKYNTEAILKKKKNCELFVNGSLIHFFKTVLK
jgi:hypothetical protein